MIIIIDLMPTNRKKPHKHITTTTTQQRHPLFGSSFCVNINGRNEEMVQKVATTRPPQNAEMDDFTFIWIYTLDASKVDLYILCHATGNQNGRTKNCAYTQVSFFCGGCHINSQNVLVCLTSNVGCAPHFFPILRLCVCVRLTHELDSAKWMYALHCFSVRKNAETEIEWKRKKCILFMWRRDETKVYDRSWCYTYGNG